MARFLSYFLFASTFFISSVGALVDHGVYGKLFPIEEEDLLVYLNGQMADRGAEGLDRVQKRMVSRVKSRSAVLACLDCRSDRVFYFDPSVAVQRDIKDEKGRVVIPKGTRVNPLDQHSLGEELLFFDGDNPKQVAWAEQNRGKWILVSGSPFDLEEEKGRAVYFDQSGLLVRKLGIEAVPARVSQEGRRLRIEELALPDRV